MPRYEPFVIGDFQLGEFAGREPWLAPEAAFTDLRNGYVYRGQLVKRGGYELFEDIAAGNPIMGIFENRLTDASSELLVLDTRRPYRLESGTLTDRSGGSDIWAGTNSDFYDFATADNDMCYIVNGVDLPQEWDGSTPTIGNATTGLTATLNWAKWVLWWKSRLWYFYTNEGGSSVGYPQRARFSDVNQPTSFDDDNFIEATTSDLMTGAQIVGDKIICTFQDSTWVIEETGDFRIPFTFRRVPSALGALGTFASFPTDEELVSLTRFGVTATNGDRVRRIDQSQPFLIDRIDPGNTKFAYGGVEPRLRQGWISFVDIGDASGVPNHQVVYNWANDSFAFYDLPMHTFGRYRIADTVTWGDLTDPWDTTVGTWDSLSGTTDAPVMLGGDRSGNVWKLNMGTRDGVTSSAEGDTYTMVARTGRLNPFKGRRVRLGYVDVFAQSAESTLRVKAIRDGDVTPSVVRDVDLGPFTAEEKVMRRITVNRTGDFHQIELENSGDAELKIDGLRLWMAPVGRGRRF
jgi:hypothetical protein